MQTWLSAWTKRPEQFTSQPTTTTTMADANYASIGFLAENIWGTTPLPPRLKGLRITGEDLMHEKETIQSQEVRADRQVADLVEVGVQAAGGFEFELSYGSFTPFLIAALFADPVVIATTYGVSSLVVAEQALYGTDHSFDDIPIGATVKLAGFDTPANNGLKLVVGKGGGGSLIFAPGSFTTAEDGPGLDVDLSGTHLRNGTTRSSFTLERRLVTSAGGDFFHTFLGQTVDSMELAFESKQIVTGSFAFVGKIGGASDTSVDADVAALGYDPADTTPVMNATANIGNFLFDNTASAECLKSLSLTIANGLRGKDCMGTKGNFDIGVGTFEVTGSLSGYFLNNALYQKYLDHADVALSWRVTDALGNTLVFTLPRLKLSTSDPKVEGRNTDVMVNADFTAILDPVTQATLIIDLHPAA
jgi:hypothetical protein